MMRRTLLIGFVVLCISALELLGQPRAIYDSWRWAHFTTESGLPSNRVFQIYETQSGGVWAATQSGLAWYNGYYWRSILPTQGLPARSATALVDLDGDSVVVLIDSRLYVGTVAGFRPITFVNGNLNTITSIVPMRTDSFLVLSDSLLYVMHNYSIMPYARPSELDTTKVLGMWSMRSGNIWLNTFAGLYRYDHGCWKLKINAGTLPLYISSIKENENGCGLAMVTSPLKFYGVWEWDETGAMKYLKSEGPDRLVAFDIASNNDAILIRESGDILVRERGVWNTLKTIPDQFQMIISAQYGRNDNLWLSTEYGLFLNKTKSRRWTQWRFGSPGPRNSVNAILPRNDGSLWLATGGGLVIWYPDGYNETITSISSTSLGPVTGMEEDNDGNVWISSGSSFDGAFRWDGSSWKHYGYREGLDAGTIHKIVKDHNGRLWFLGLLRADFETRQIEREPGAYVLENGKFVAWGPREGVLGGRVLAFADEPSGALWFGTSAGLSKWTPDGEWKYWTTNNGLKINRIFAIAIDADGTAWLGDQTSGLGYIRNDSVGYMTTEDGLISNTVWNIQIDKEGKLWIVTRSGVGVYNNGVWSKLDGKDGLENVRVWPLVVGQNIVYIGTNGGGVCGLRLDEVRKEQPVIVIPQLLVKENTISAECRPYAYWNEQEPEDILIRYRVDTDPWSSWTTKRIITQENLTSGDHKIEFQSIGFLSKLNPIVWTNSFHIEPPFYLQVRFILPVGMLLTTVIVIALVFLKKKHNQDKSLRLSELRYRNLFENTTDPIVVFDPGSNSILEVNKKATEIYGYKKTDLVHQSVSVLSKDFEIERQYIQHAIEDRAAQTYEAFHLKKDRNEFPVLVNLSVVEYGGISVILSINRDISEHLQAEAKIRLLAQTIASAQDYVSITDLDNNILFVNESFTKAYGYGLEELYGKHISILHSVLTPIDIFENVYTTTRGKGWNGELFNRKKDGSEFLVELWTSPVKNEEGTPVAFVGVARDITERKRAEKERDTLIQNLTEAIAEVKTLSGLLPICSSCKKIRDDQGYWTQVETYIAKYSAATFTHGLCPDCLKEYFPEIYNRMKDKDLAK
jgi:PAS domain S-box-containing protein